ncbi:MAG: hypothetical protein J6D03_00530 [Clostridia bacterium]|nr:hypothetical protein [Clostridia bacterium]
MINNRNIELETEIIQYVSTKGKGIHWNKFPQQYIEYLSNIYIDSKCNRELYLRLLHNIIEIPKCPICGNLCEYCGSIKYPYKLTCGKKECSNKIRQIHVNKTFIKKYGKIGFVNQEKCKKTKLEKYGDENYVNPQKAKQTCIIKYGCEHPCQSEEIKEKIRQTNIIKYGVENVYMSEEIKNKIKLIKFNKYGDEHFVNGKKISESYNNKTKEELENIINKIKQTKLERYGNSNYNNIEKRKQTCLNKYGVDHNWKIPEEHLLTHTIEANNKRKLTSLKNWGTEYPSQSPIIKKRVKETIRKNNIQIGTSIIEQKLFKLLQIKYPDAIIHYIDKRYGNFECDYYIPSKDLFIEYQGHQSHGGHPYDKNNLKDIELANWIKETFNNNKAFTQLDPMKRHLAKINNLNWLEFWTDKEFKEWLNKEES